MFASLKLLDINPGDEILTPAWDCDGSLQPFREMGCKLNFYRINVHDLTVDLAHIESLISEKTKLIHIINYFGFPQPWNDIIKLRNKINIPVLEDNAYSVPYFNKNTNNLGSFGDFSIFSLRKVLNISGGSLLIDNRKVKLEISPIKGTRLIYPAEILKLRSLIFSKVLILPKFKHTFIFNVIGKGKTELKIIYHRPWEKNKPPSTTFDINIIAKYTCY